GDGQGDTSVDAVEIGQLQDVLAVAQEQLGHGATEHRVHGPLVGKGDQEDLLPRARDGEVRNDASARDHGGTRECLLQAADIGLDRMGLEGGGGKGIAAVEADRPTVEEAWKPEIPAACRPRQVRELGSAAGSQVEEEYLRRLVPGRVWAEVDERDTPAVGTDPKDQLGGRES